MKRRKKRDNMKFKPKKVIVDKIQNACAIKKMHAFMRQVFSKFSLQFHQGIGFINPTKQEHNQFTYFNHPNYQVFPTFGNTYPLPELINAFTRCPGLPRFTMFRILHGENYTEFFNPIKVGYKLINKGKILDIIDKKKHGVCRVECNLFQEQANGELLPIMRTIGTIILRDKKLAGFGYTGDPVLNKQNELPVIPKRKPDQIVLDKTYKFQALIHCWANDKNPIHIDPILAKQFGHDQPYMHGFCLFGIMARIIYENCLNYDLTRFKSLRGRFLSIIYPGETIKLQIWYTTKNVIVFLASIIERPKKPIFIGEAVFHEKITPKL